MDIYVIVTELDFPDGMIGPWRTDTAGSRRSVEDALDQVEGDATEVVDRQRYGLRAFLIDAAYFDVREDLEAAFARAASLGARGSWYSGDLVSGTLGHLGGTALPTKLGQLPPEVARWVMEAGRLGVGSGAIGPPAPRAKAAPKKKAKAAPKKKAKAAPKKKAKAAPKKKAKAAFVPERAARSRSSGRRK